MDLDYQGLIAQIADCSIDNKIAFLREQLALSVVSGVRTHEPSRDESGVRSAQLVRIATRLPNFLVRKELRLVAVGGRLKNLVSHPSHTKKH